MKKIKLICLSILLSFQLSAFDEFLVSDIRIIGLQRVSTGSIFNVIPISVGDRIDQRKSNDIVRSLFSTEQFDDIQIGKDGNTLIITVEERPSISAIELSGNKALKTEQLLESLDGVGIKEGEVYKRSTLEKVKSELVRSYASNGRYGASVSIEEIDKPRNRIEIDIEVDEGKSAKIEKINIIGNEIFTTDEIRRLGDELPYLVLHSPTHHPMQLDTILGDLVYAHLDPDHSLLWNIWEKKLSQSILPGVDDRQARERILYLLHLNSRGNLSHEETLNELKEFIKPVSIQGLLLNEDAQFNWVKLQRLIAHARAWQSEVFDLLDRLQNDLLSGSATITKDDWRMDLALASKCDNGTGHLFIALNNQTPKDRHLRVEVIVPGGMPESQNHRFELSSCPGPSDAVKITDPLIEDALDWMPKYLEKGVILWIGVAWKEGIKGHRNVQVILRDDDNIILGSRIIRTQVLTGDSSVSKQRLKRMLKARNIGESPLPTLDVIATSS